ncbi:MAG: DUF2244 domain-containing protein [Pseudomonadota bacterium]
MPVTWDTDFETAAVVPGAPLPVPVARVVAEPHQSMTPEGFVGFMVATLSLVALPLLTLLGSPVLWGLLPFFALAIWGLWTAIGRNQRDRAMTETLTLWHDKVELVRKNPQGPEQRWDANPYWVSVHLHPGEKPVENYLTLKGAGREVEFGAFLGPDERLTLHTRLTDLFGSLGPKKA